MKMWTHIAECVPSPPVIYQPIIQCILQTPSLASKEDILRFLNVDGQAIQQPLLEATAPRFRHAQENANLLQLVLKSLQFTHWMRSNESDVLVLRRGPVDRQVSQTFAFLAATLVETLSTSTTAVVLHLFCGGLEEETHPPGSYWFLRSLIFQLMQYQNSASIRSDALSVSTYEPNHLRALLLHILHSLPVSQTVFVLAHGLGYHEYDDEAETVYLLHLLAELGSLPPDPKLRVKVLLTPSTPSMTGDIVPFEKQLYLPEECDYLPEYSLPHVLGMMGGEMLY